MSSTTIHPACGTRYAANNTVGHCSGCCRTFSGIGAFDKHQFHLDGKLLCSDPSASGSDKWWLDEDEVWHWGPRLTEEQKKEIWG